MSIALLLIVAYLIGSIPFGYLIVRFKERSDVRETGSGGTGATNVSRKAGKLAGVLTLFLDFAKGILAILVADAILRQIDITFCAEGYLSCNVFWRDSFLCAAGVMAILGHCFPVWLKFRGGKGVATGLGVFFTLAPIGVLCVAAIILVIAFLTRYVSLGSIIGFALLPLFVWKFRLFLAPVFYRTSSVVASAVSALIIIFMHRENIKRLLRGEENKFR